jgi:hypothetical protein
MTPKTDGPYRSPLARLWHAPAWAVLLAIMVLGGALRFYQVGAVPPGLYQDEAYNGLDALNILAGSHPIYFPANNGREPFYMYAAAASVGEFGRTPLALRFPSAVVGMDFSRLLPATASLATSWKAAGTGSTSPPRVRKPGKIWPCTLPCPTESCDGTVPLTP